MATYNHKIRVTNGNSTDIYHPETNSNQVYDFTNSKWLNETIGALNTLSTTQKSSIVGALNELATRLLVSNNSKNLESPLNTNQVTNIPTASTATPVLNIAVAENGMGLCMFNYSVGVIANSVSRHVEGGTLKILVLRASAEAVKFSISIEDRISLTQTYSTTASGEIDPITGNLIVKMSVDNTWMASGFAQFRLIPITTLKNNNTIVVTQL